VSASAEARIQPIPQDERLILSLDVADFDSAKALVERLGDAVSFYKIGLELATTRDYFRLLGSGFTETTRVELNGNITTQWTSAHEDWWPTGAFRIVSDAEIRIYPPQGLNPANYNIRTYNGLSFSNAFGVQIAANKTSVLRTSSEGLRPSADLKEIRYASANLVHRLRTDLFLGAEMLWGEARRVDLARADDTRIQITARYYLY